MTLLDAYALIAVLTRGPAEPLVRELLRQGKAAMPVLNVTEVLDVAQRTRGVSEQLAWAGVEGFLGDSILPIPLSLELAREAARIRAAHYHRTDRPLSLADCVLLASGVPGDRVVTADPHVLDVAPLVGLEAVELPGEA